MKVVARWRRPSQRSVRDAPPDHVLVRVGVPGSAAVASRAPISSACSRSPAASGTILVILARRRRLQLDSVTVLLDDGGKADRAVGMLATVRIVSEEDPGTLEEAVSGAARACPTELLYRLGGGRAGAPGEGGVGPAAPSGLPSAAPAVPPGEETANPPRPRTKAVTGPPGGVREAICRAVRLHRIPMGRTRPPPWIVLAAVAAALLMLPAAGAPRIGAAPATAPPSGWSRSGLQPPSRRVRLSQAPGRTPPAGARSVPPPCSRRARRSGT